MSSFFVDRCSEIPGNGNLIKGTRCYNDLGIKKSCYLIPVTFNIYPDREARPHLGHVAKY